VQTGRGARRSDLPKAKGSVVEWTTIQLSVTKVGKWPICDLERAGASVANAVVADARADGIGRSLLAATPAAMQMQSNLPGPQAFK
jgi:hypothetical protein